MRSFFICTLFLLPVLAYASSSVIASPESQASVLPIAQPENAQEYFGELGGYPHTFEFKVTESTPFKAAVYVADRTGQKNDVSIIVVKQGRRGVTEIGRTLIANGSWETQRDSMLALSFRNGGKLESELEPGTYTLEVSSPNNEGVYRLVWGTGKIKRGYFENLSVLFEVRSLLHASVLGTFLSPLLYVPVMVFLLNAGIVIFLYLKRRRN